VFDPILHQKAALHFIPVEEFRTPRKRMFSFN